MERALVSRRLVPFGDFPPPERRPEDPAPTTLQSEVSVWVNEGGKAAGDDQ